MRLSMSLKKTIYNKFPTITKPVAKHLYENVINFRKSPEYNLRSEFIDEMFDDKHEYEEYVSEFKHGSGVALRKRRLKNTRR
jgi:hypothetical protein